MIDLTPPPAIVGVLTAPCLSAMRVAIERAVHGQNPRNAQWKDIGSHVLLSVDTDEGCWAVGGQKVGGV